ncbi:hypothetical protein HZA76_03300 [Candidatus Roizmanbacteria bacterium]|nr:hypothetical protein [Candidatus Roizmanbacteria bacterium]
MFLIFLFALTTFLFRNAFNVYFFNDDFFFLKISRITNIGQFFHFFSPDKNYFYRPLSTEVFYSLIHFLKENAFLSHLLVFTVFFIGIYYFHKIVTFLFKDKFLTALTTIFYALNFTHVFQLYYFGTFQEIAAFTLLNASFFYFLTKKNFFSIIFFILALLSKESAVFYLPFLIIFSLIKNRSLDKKLIPYFIASFFSILIYKNGLSSASSLENYSLQSNLKLTINNFVWYSFWSLGVPNFTSLYFISIFKAPIIDFWKMLKNFPEIKNYYLLLISYYLILFITVTFYFLKNKNKINQIKNLAFISLLGFVIFLGPILFIEHRWMVRLTIPLVFVVLIQSFLITYLMRGDRIFKIFGLILIVLYLGLQILGTSIHESSSTFLLESRFTKNAERYFEKSKKEIVKHSFIYFKDSDNQKFNPWGGSEKLKVTLSDQNFIDHYFPGTSLQAAYGFEDKIIPKNAYIISSYDILLQRQ